MQQTVKPSDVIFLDASYTSCVTALLLAKAGVRAILLTDARGICPEVAARLPFFWPSLNDPPTRAVVAHSIEVAEFLNDFCQRGVEFFEATIKPALNLKNPVVVPKVWRVGFEEYEVTELKQAAELNLLKKDRKEDTHFQEFGYGIFQSSSELTSALESALNAEKLIRRQTRHVTMVEKPSDICVVHCDDGSQLTCEMLICNDDATIRRVFPKFQDVLVPMSDVVLHTAFEYSHTKTEAFAARSSNGHAAGVCVASQRALQLWLSGPRFLLPQAGANTLLPAAIVTDDLKQRLLTFHQKNLLQTFLRKLDTHQLAFPDVAHWTVSLDYDCWPCDEMPILGELGLAGRALGCAGWLATHLSAGSAAAKTMVDYVLTGRNKHVHPLLDPRRLFIA